MEYDIVVVGCGVAGTAAAVGAAENARALGRSLRIAILERTSEEKRGGSSRWTGAHVRMMDEQTLRPNFLEDMISYSDGLSDISYVRTLAEKAPETIGWVKSKGVDFGHSAGARLSAMTQFYSGIFPQGGGLSLIEALVKEAEKLGVMILYNTTAWRLSLGEGGIIDGIWVRSSNDGRAVRIGARALILGCGGFEGNPEMLTKYVTKDAVRLRTLAEGSVVNKGEGIQMAVEIGAKSSGQWDQFHAELVDPRSRKPEATVMIYPYGILIDQDGKRFLDEGATTHERAYQGVARRIFELPNHRAYLVTDQKLFSIQNYQILLGTDQGPIEANSLVELADKIGVPHQAFLENVKNFNSAVQPGIFDPTKEDGRRTKGIFPPKSNWAFEIDKPPFVCYPVECAIVFTFGGLATDNRARVLSADDYPIPGLYAAGEIVGLYYRRYPGGTSVLRGLVFGRIAGYEASLYVGQPG